MIDKVKGIINRDSNEWTEEFSELVSDVGYGVFWKDQVSDLNSILGVLRKRINEDGFFYYYNISSNMTNYKAKVVDFATKETYKDVVDDWKQKSAAWLSDTFDGYSDDKNNRAAIAFLVSEFVEIPKSERYNISQFETLWGKNAWIKNAVAYTNILTKEFMKMKEIRDILLTNHNIVLNGAPGTGKTHLALELTRQLEAEYSFVQFHPSYDYTDFVEGLRPIKQEGKDIAFERKNGAFKKLCEQAVKSILDGNETKFIMIIDEINRGDMSKIFGEGFFSIDKGYRAKAEYIRNLLQTSTTEELRQKALQRIMPIETQYQNLINPNSEDCFRYGFFVPENVYIIGTMNDIDRSVESMDFAMRRRFVFKEIVPDFAADAMGLSDIAKNKMKAINSIICKSESDGLGSSYQVGPSYFKEVDDFETLWQQSIEPLLEEYLRGNPIRQKLINELREKYNAA